MGKAKPVKKPSSPLKISTSLFRRRSKNSTGQVDRESVSSTSSGKAGKVLKTKVGVRGKGKVGSKQSSTTSTSTGNSGPPTTTSSNATTGKQQKKKTATDAISTTIKKGSEGKQTQGKKKGVASTITKKQGKSKSPPPAKGKPSNASKQDNKSKTAARKEKEKSPSPKFPKKAVSSGSGSSSGNSSGSEAEKVTTRKRSRSDADLPLSPVTDEGESSSSSSSSRSSTSTSSGGKKKPTQKNKKTTMKSTPAKKVLKKSAPSVVASKKKLPVKGSKPGTNTNLTKTKGKVKAAIQEKEKAKKQGNKGKSATTTKDTSTGKGKSKVKPKPKIKLTRMASLNAKAILEASFSFEQEKKQRSPVPCSSSILAKMKTLDDLSGNVGASNGKPITGSTQKGNDDVKSMKSISVSTSTSPLPQPPSSIQKPAKVGAGSGSSERKRKSSETSRRESTTSTSSKKSSLTKSKQTKGSKDVPNHLISSGSGRGSPSNSKGSSRRNSSAVSDSDSKAKKSRKQSPPPPSPKKKTKVSKVTTTSTSTSTSTGTSPLHSAEFYSEEKQKKSKHKGKKEKGRSVDSGTNTYTSSSVTSRSQDSGIQVERDNKTQLKSAGCQAKEKKSSSVAHFGTIYQPAGPLIEPHKTSASVPAGLLPETVKLPPDLKVTYQTHPPTSNISTVSHSSSSSSKASKKHHASSSSTSTSSHHLSHTKTDKSGQILHQPYKSSLSASSSGSQSMSASHSRQVQPGYSGMSYVSPATGSPLISSPLLSQQSAAVGHQQLASGLGIPGHHHHSISSTGSSSSVGGPSQQLPQPSASAGAPSAGGLFYSSSSGFAPHHSPFAPCKYPMVPPDSYRTHSPYPNSFLYPQTTPQPSQSYFMTPFYTPPLTPNSNVVAGGLGQVVGQPRPLSIGHHPSIATASFYAPQSQPSLHHPSNYLVASPHHSLQPTPTAPGHAGLFHPNPCTQPACPCPTESCQQSSTSNNKPQQQQQSAFSGSLPVLEAGAKEPKPHSQALVSTTATRPSRHSNKDVPPHPPTCVTPAVAADPPVTIKLMNPNQTQARQLESAKTFTEQYSLPDDITITPIIYPNSNANALLLKNTSISVISPNSGPLQLTNNSPANLTTSKLTKKKEKDIVHVIDPRSGQKTTIAKHISNRNLLAKNITSKNLKSINSHLSPPPNPNNATIGHTVSRLKPNINKIGSVGVGKLNPDLDVIVINNTGSKACDDITENVKLVHHKANKSKNTPTGLQSNINTNKPNKKPMSIIPTVTSNTKFATGKNKSKGQLLSKRIALADNDNNHPRMIDPLSSVPFPSAFNYSLPPGISISPGVALNLSGATLNNITSLQNQGLNLCVRPMAVQNSQKSDFPRAHQNHQHALVSTKTPKGAKKRISLNECIDELQKKRLKLLEDHNFVVNANGNCEFVNGNVILPSNGRSKASLVSQFNKGLPRGKFVVKDTYSSARVRDPELNLGGTVIKSSDAVVAVSAVVLDHETYHLTRASRGLPNKGLKNGLQKGKFQQRKNYMQSVSLGKKDINFGSSSKMKSRQEKGRFLSQRNTRSAAANAKIRTRLSAKPGSGGRNDNQTLRGRSRLLSKGNQMMGSSSNRKSESDCSSTNTSRSNSAVRISNGNISNGRLERDRTRENKYPTQAFINAVADLYQYRRNVMLRVPRAGVGVFPSANSINLLGLSDGPQVSPSPPISRSSLSPQERGKMQLSPSAFSRHVKQDGSSSPRSSSPANVGTKSVVGSMVANAAKKRALVKPLSPASINSALIQLGMARRSPKWSNGWRFEGDPYEAKVYVNNDDQSVLRRCYPAMRHESGDVIQTRDCVLLKSGSKKNDLPFIAKIAALWENPADGEMMFSLLWYYRPEHTDMGRTKEDMTDEIFASKHIDVNSVATIDDRCYVLTFNEYCRYRKRLKQLEEGLPNKPLLSLTGSSMVNRNAAGAIASAVWSGRSLDPNQAPSPGKISPEVVFFCRKVYDFRQKRIMKNPS